jgi:glycosyltransferase involved in cell wall biosynthesis
VTVPHALYGDVYPAVGSAAARMALGLPPEREVVGYIGDIKAYKGLDLLLDAYAKAGPAAPVLLVAGAAPYDAELSAATKRQVDAVTSAGAPVAWVNRRLSTEDFSGGLAASDLVIAPYRTSWNSGIATLALEHGRPLLCTDLPIFRELQSEVGADWVRLFTPPLTLERVVSAVAEGQPESADAMERLRAFRERRSWTAAGREIGAFYSRLCNLAQRQS